MSTAATALRLYYTGAASDGAYQSNPAASLGGFRSSVLVPMMEPRRINDMPGVKIVDLSGNGGVSGASGVGVGTLRAATTGSLAWKPPGGSEGTAIAIANGETKVLEGLGGGATEYQWIQVERVLAADLQGSETVSCLEIYNNIFDDVSSAEAVAGVTDYRAFIIKAGDENLTFVKFWFTDTAATTWQIALETPGAGGDIQTIATDVTAPTGLTWYSATFASQYVLGSLSAGQSKGVWIKRTVAADTAPAGKVLCGLTYQCLTPSKFRVYSIPSRHRVKRDDYVGWGVWIGQDADPDLDAAPTEIFTSRPYVTTYVPAASHNYHLGIRTRNAYGLWELNREIEVIPISATGAIDNVLPSAPVNVAIAPASSNNATITGLYYPAPDGDDRADGFVIWGTVDGTTPSKSSTPTGYQAMSTQDGIEQLSYAWTTGAEEAAPLKAIVSTRRLVDGTGTTQDADVNQLPASGAGSVGTSGSFSDWAASGGAVIRKANGGVREIVTYASRTDSVLTVASGGRAQLWTSAGAGADSDTVEPLAYVDSDNVDVVTATAGSIIPIMPHGVAFFGRESAISRGSSIVVVEPEEEDRLFWVDEDKNIFITCLRDNWAYFYSDTQLIWAAYYNSIDATTSRFYIPSEMSMIETGSYSSGDNHVDPITVDAWNGTKELGINVNFTLTSEQHGKAGVVDIDALSLSFGTYEENKAGDYSPQEIVLQIPAAFITVFSLWDAYLNAWIDYLTVGLTGGTAIRCAQIDNTKTQAEIEALS